MASFSQKPLKATTRLPRLSRCAEHCFAPSKQSADYCDEGELTVLHTVTRQCFLNKYIFKQSIHFIIDSNWINTALMYETLNLQCSSAIAFSDLV